MTESNLLEPPAGYTPFELAEWLETSFLLEDIKSISQAEIEERFASGQGPDAAGVEELVAEVRARANRFPSVYPLRTSDEEIYRADDVDGTVYWFLVILAMDGVPYRTQSRWNDIGPAFELITREAGLAALGHGAEAVRFGWPNGDGRPAHLAEATDWLAGRLGLDTNPPAETEVDEDDKDGGIDVVVWNGFGDNNPAFPVTLFQCTVQAKWEKKAADVVPNKWSTWIRFGTPPRVGLSVPQTVNGASKSYANIKYESDNFLERLRLCYLIQNRDLTQFAEHEFMANWTSAEVDLILEELAKPATPTGNKKKAAGPRLPKPRRPRKEPEDEIFNKRTKPAPG